MSISSYICDIDSYENPRWVLRPFFPLKHAGKSVIFFFFTSFPWTQEQVPKVLQILNFICELESFMF